MKIVLLGCGYLGYNLANELYKKYPDLTCAGIEGPYSALMYQRFVALDAFDFEQLKQIDFKDAIVIDAISTVDNHEKSNEEDIVLDALEEKYTQLLKQLKQLNAKQYVFISSAAVYGNTTEPVDEETPPNPVNFYTRSRVRLEKTIEKGPLDYLILRLASPYGGFRMTNKRQGVIPILIEKALDGDEFEMLKEESTVRDYFYMTDFANAIELLLENEVSNEIVNVGSGNCYSLKNIIEVVKRTTGESVKIKKIETDVNILDSVSLDISKLQRRTGFDCEVGITTGVYRELNRILNGRENKKKY